MMRWCIAWWMLWTSCTAAAHPLSRDKWSLRTALQLQDGKLDAVVVLEVPFQVVKDALDDDMERARKADDVRAAAQKVLDDYTASHWKRLADGLSITVDGEAPAGAWKPRDNRMNGKGAVTGGFFMYIVEFVPEAPLALDDDVTIRVVNQGYPDLPMVYSAMVVSGDGWTVASDSSTGVLPDRPYDLNAPDFWSPDEALRTVVARYTRKP